MSLQDLLDFLYRDTDASLRAFLPELTLCATTVVILLARVLRLTAKVDSFFLALTGSAIALWFAVPWQQIADGGEMIGNRVELFTGLLVYDSFTAYIRVILLSFAVLFAIFTRISGIPDREAAPDFYCCVLGATLGMCLMAEANHLLIVFLGVEMASVPSYALAGLLKGRRQSSEAALKYAVYGAGTAGVMLYGISLLAGLLGSVHIPTMTQRLAMLVQESHGSNAGGHVLMVLALGALMVMVGLAFKLSAVPFHFWCPDVFEGASAEVNAFLSVASKAAALALLVRVALGFAYLPSGQALQVPIGETAHATSDPPAMPASSVAKSSPASTAKIHAVAKISSKPGVSPVVLNHDLKPVREFLAKLLAFIAIITCTFGNLAAYGQTNIKRLLAYSTIAHAGYMMMAVAAAVALVGQDPTAAEAAIGALAVYIGVYLFMNLGAFAVVAFLRNQLHSENIADYAGLIRRAPLMVICFSIILFSLIGLPPLAGFTGKFLIFAALVDANLITLLIVAGLNTAVSLFYYLRVVKVMTMDPEPANRPPLEFSFIPATYIAVLTLPVVLLGLWWNGLYEFAQAAARHLFA